MEIPPVNQDNPRDRGPIPSRGRRKPNGSAWYVEEVTNIIPVNKKAVPVNGRRQGVDEG